MERISPWEEFLTWKWLLSTTIKISSLNTEIQLFTKITILDCNSKYHFNFPPFLSQCHKTLALSIYLYIYKNQNKPKFLEMVKPLKTWYIKLAKDFFGLSHNIFCKNTSKIFGQPSGNMYYICCCLITQLCLKLLGLHGLQPASVLCPQDSTGKDVGVCCHCWATWEPHVFYYISLHSCCSLPSKYIIHNV